MFFLRIFLIFLIKEIILLKPIKALLPHFCELVDGDCPHKDVNFWLFTRERANDPLKLSSNHLNRSDFPTLRPLYILIHGYTGYRDFAPNNFIRPVLLQKENPYIISLDYGRLVPEPCYVTAVSNLRLVSKCLGYLINQLVDQNLVSNDMIHVIGFSLGAQVAGQTANYVKRKLKHITGLDPAKPLFLTAPPEGRLDAGDAEFVDVIHTDVFGRGMLRALGHVDFYVNHGFNQPGCIFENPKDPGSCNHDRAPIYYAESIANPNGFWAYSCTSWLHNILNLCPYKSNDQILGLYVRRSVHGVFFLTTSDRRPYALGPITPHHPQQPPQSNQHQQIFDNINDFYGFTDNNQLDDNEHISRYQIAISNLTATNLNPTYL